MLWTFSFPFREIEEYMNDKVKYVVTSSKWDDNFDDVSTLDLDDKGFFKKNIVVIENTSTQPVQNW